MDIARGPLVERPPVESSPEVARRPAWHVLWTRSNCEALVSDQLTAKGFHVFLPTLEVWMRRGAARQRHRVAMFPGYVFLHHALDKWSDVEIRKARGLVMILGDAWDRRAVVPATEVDRVRRRPQSRLPPVTHAYLRQGHRVRIARGRS